VVETRRGALGKWGPWRQSDVHWLKASALATARVVRGAFPRKYYRVRVVEYVPKDGGGNG
jgi:hypothetical protein